MLKISYSNLKFLSLILTVSYVFSCGLLFAQSGPFFPLDAGEKGVSRVIIGLISGTFDATTLLFGLFCSQFQKWANLKVLFWMGYLVCSVTTILFGILTFFSTPWVYILLSFTFRAINGAGCALGWSTIFPLIFALYPKQKGNLTALVEINFELGGVIGPLVGTLLFSIKGYYLPFLVLGIVGVILAVLCIIFMLPHHVTASSEDESAPLITAPDEEQFVRENLTMWKVFTTFEILVASIPHSVVSLTLGLFSVFLTPFLIDIVGVEEVYVGMFFLVSPLAALIVSPIVGFLVNWKLKWALFILSPLVGLSGCLAFSSVLFFRGVHMQALTILALAQIGFCYSTGFISGTVVLEDVFCLHAKGDHKKEYRIIMSAWSQSICFVGGRFIGSSVIGGIVFEYVGFGGVTVIHSFMYFVAVVSAFTSFFMSSPKTRDDYDWKI